MTKLTSALNKIRVTESPIKSVTCDITPETAEALLKEFNSHNRAISKTKAALYANELLRNKWALNGEPLIFGEDDKGECLISGQHRLLALTMAKKIHDAKPDEFPEACLTLHTVVVYGVDMTTADTVDQINPRSHGDVLFRDEWANSVMGEDFKKNTSRRNTWCRNLAGAARLVWLRAGGATVSSAPKFLTSEMLDFVKYEHPELATFVNFIATAADGKDNNGLRMSIPYVAALTYVACLSIDENRELVVDDDLREKMFLFVSQVASGTGFTPGSPAHAITQYWNKLITEPGSKDRDLEWVAPFVKCLQSVVAGEPTSPSKLKLTKKEAENYKIAPCLLPGWDTDMFEYSKLLESQSFEQKEAAKQKAIDDKAALKEKREAERAEKAAAKEAEKAEKAAAKEAEKATEKETELKSATSPAPAPTVVGKFRKPANLPPKTKV